MIDMRSEPTGSDRVLLSLLTGLAALLLTGLVACQDPEPTTTGEGDGATPQDPVKAMFEQFREAGLEVDREAGTITVPCEIARPDQPLEYLLIHRRGKDHEAMFVCEVQASLLNAAFLLLGYEKGKNAEVVEKDPLPSPEEVEKGAAWFDVHHPEGMKVWFTAKWTKIDDDGEEVVVEAPVEDLLLDRVTGEAVVDVEWIYLGGNMAPIYRNEPPVFLADYEGNYVSNVYKPQPNHLVTMKHERAQDDQVWWVTELLPPPATPVKLVIHKAETPLHRARLERLAREKKDAAEQAAEDDGKKESVRRD